MSSEHGLYFYTLCMVPILLFIFFIDSSILGTRILLLVFSCLYIIKHGNYLPQ